ncbi:Histamine H1 Receptor [Manis pentadactyla]|nr:Histamine H1 Receptor [Manis pentadactyla]
MPVNVNSHGSLHYGRRRSPSSVHFSEEQFTSTDSQGEPDTPGKLLSWQLFPRKSCSVGRGSLFSADDSVTVTTTWGQSEGINTHSIGYHL